ncbi:hypothetical protein ACIQI7_11300 [Kitasatospora sp. NPDC092039]|uniref:hypothetical protein n=1 Tax=unclassified Kitasatospora TaxID=2633591 RepID=UPI0036A2BAE8|nr:hypothetical protein KitaXyl93_22340 [Kitasatospora sp. Xyl93]
MATERKKLLLRLDPSVHDALARWAADDLRSTNAQIEFLLRRALTDAGRMPGGAARLPRRGRPPKQSPAEDGPAGENPAEDGPEPGGSEPS